MEHSRIPNSFKMYRRKAGYSQKEVAALLGLKKTSCLSRWEKGLAYPSIKHLFELSLLYKTYPHHLYDEFWDVLEDKTKKLEYELLAQQESIISNERYYL